MAIETLKEMKTLKFSKPLIIMIIIIVNGTKQSLMRRTKSRSEQTVHRYSLFLSAAPTHFSTFVGRKPETIRQLITAEEIRGVLKGANSVHLVLKWSGWYK